jgi:hypothetical protein
MIFTEGRKGSEEAGVCSHQISKRVPFLLLMAKYRQRFTIFAQKGLK